MAISGEHSATDLLVRNNVARQRTSGMTAIGVLNIVFGSTGIVISLFVILMAHAMMSRLLGNDQGMNMVLILFAWTIVFLPVAVIGLIAGIGILRMTRWARVLSLVYAGLILMSMVLGLVLNRMLTSLVEIPSPDVQSSSSMLGNAIGVVTLAIQVGYPVIVIILFHKPTWKAAFASHVYVERERW